MGSQDVELMRQLLEAFDRRDREAWVALHHPDAEVRPSQGFPEAGAVHGAEAAWEYYMAAAEPFEWPATSSADLIDAGPGKVLIHHRHDVRGRASGVDVVLEYWVLATFEDGLVVRDEWFDDRTQAFAAAGLAAT